MIKGLYIMNKDQFDNVYSIANREEIEKYVHIYHPPLDEEEIITDPSILNDAEVIFGGWGFPLMDQNFLQAASSLRAVFYGAGSIRRMVTSEFWKSGIKLTSAYAANAVPVAEYTLAQILFSLKRGWYHMEAIRQAGAYIKREFMPGAYKSTVGLISLGMIGRKVVDLLQSFDLNIIAYDPFISEDDAKEMGITMVSLEEVFKSSDVVSLHTPWLKETEGMINGSLFSHMKKIRLLSIQPGVQLSMNRK